MTSCRHPQAAVALACATAILAIAPRQAHAQTAVAPAPATEPAITTLADIFVELILAGQSGGSHEMDPASSAAIRGAGIDVAEKFLRLPLADMLMSEALTDHSRELLPSSLGRQFLIRLDELRTANWHDKIVDARFAGDRLATLILVFTPRSPQEARQTATVDLVRKYDHWQVTLDLEADAALPLGDEATASVAALRAAVAARVAEIEGLIAQPLAEPLPFHGTWTTHFRQSGVYLTFDSNGEVFILKTEGNGGASYSVHDYHLTNDEVIIEANSVPLRIKRHAGDNYWEQDGVRYYGLRIDDARIWFPECTDSLFMKPVYKGDWPVHRPPAPAK